jgi:hypothetical protein
VIALLAASICLPVSLANPKLFKAKLPKDKQLSEYFGVEGKFLKVLRCFVRLGLNIENN